MSESVITPVLAVHLLCVNVASAGPLVAIWLDWKAARGDQIAGEAGRFLSWVAVVLLLVGGGVGVLVGWFLWTDQYRDILTLFERRIYFGVWEYFFSLILMTLSAVWWSWRPTGGKAARGTRMLLQLLAGTNLIYHFPFLFVIVSGVLKGQLETPQGAIDGAQFRQMITDGGVVTRVMHIVFASFAVSGLALMVYAIAQQRRQNKEAVRVARWGGWIALVPTICQIPVGLWVLLQLPRPSQMAVMGGDPLTASLLGISVVLSLMLLHTLSAVALGEATVRSQVQSIGLMVLIVFLMTGVLRLV